MTEKEKMRRLKLENYQDMVLPRDLPEERLKRGDIVKLVEQHLGRRGQAAIHAG